MDTTSPELVTVELDQPLARGADTLAVISFARFSGHALQGLSLAALGQAGFDEVRTLMSRISLEGLIVEEVDRLGQGDIMGIAHELAQMLSPPADQPDCERLGDDDSPSMIRVPLRKPLLRDGGDLTHVTIRRADSGAFRGLSLARLGQMIYEELRTLITRTTLEALKPAEVDALDAGDILVIASEVGDFLLPKRLRTA